MSLRLLGLMALSGLIACPAEFTGYISDEPCGWNDARPGKEAKECAQKCVRVGWAAVFVRDGETSAYKIKDKAIVLPYVGDHVTVEAELQGDTLSIKKIRVSAPPVTPKKAK